MAREQKLMCDIALPNVDVDLLPLPWTKVDDISLVLVSVFGDKAVEDVNSLLKGDGVGKLSEDSCKPHLFSTERRTLLDQFFPGETPQSLKSNILNYDGHFVGRTL